MKPRILFALAMVVALAFATEAWSQEKAKPATKPAPDEQEMMKKWMEAATPGEGHKALDYMVGKWDLVMRMWMDGPERPPSESKGSAETRWVLDGRFLIEEMSGQVMGMAYKGMTFIGYDNFKKKYGFSHADNMGTAIYTGEGTFDQSGKVLTMIGKADEPMTGERDKIVKYVTRIISKDKYVFEIHDLVGTPHEFKALEMIYTRKP